MTTTNYNAIAEQYKQCKEHPWRSRIETYSILKRLGNIEGKKVLDVACGEGFYTRKLRHSGAGEVVGIDLSEAMIRLALDHESRAPLGITYRVEDACTKAVRQECDLAVSAWLLVYARNQSELLSMCHGIASRVKPGGRFITFTGNPNVYAFRQVDYRKYGFSISLTDRPYEGAPIVWTVYLDDSSFGIENYYLPMKAYETAFAEAGFYDFKVHLPEVSPHPQGMDDGAFWSDYLAHPPAVLMECVKK
ncbi:MAG TPA: class I SAM-dependent methyltransferase [Nitrospira sp.]|nr:class I SAM-dependent methyltransferase [Nitrospira sp.]